MACLGAAEPGRADGAASGHRGKPEPCPGRRYHDRPGDRHPGVDIQLQEHQAAPGGRGRHRLNHRPAGRHALRGAAPRPRRCSTPYSVRSAAIRPGEVDTWPGVRWSAWPVAPWVARRCRVLRAGSFRTSQHHIFSLQPASLWDAGPDGFALRFVRRRSQKPSARTNLLLCSY